MTRAELNTALAPHFGWEICWGAGKGWQEVGKPWTLRDDPPDFCALTGPYFGMMVKELTDHKCELCIGGNDRPSWFGFRYNELDSIGSHDDLGQATGLAYLALKS